NIRYPNAEIFFIIGADQLERLNCWKDIEVLSKICIFVCANRPGVEGVLIEENLAKLRDSTGLRIRYIEMPPWDVSSTRIREGIRFGRGARYLVPEAVADYVARHGLYRGEYDFAGILERLERDLPGWLYAHSLGTMEIAVKMGEHYEADGATLEKIRLAALLHDCGKPDSGKMTFQKLAEKCSPTYQLSDFFAGKPEMYHCYLSSIYAREKFGISEFDILSAIASHTFATKNMSFTDKIIFVADMLDEGRPSEDGCENIRTLAFQDLNKAVIAAIQYHINKHTIAGNKIFPPSYEVLEYLIEEQKNG
ncbi:MAG: bis(5'-nucleosyl)-tetraphosphatase (symmetrical) YqeK, partial [Defluviitaleaceae bacterium]|nr:bis(5'-nucleosyl)-tetraphosphatase (symmetrical) YqeK [Defluviitaleaceae bacterium]